MGGHGGLNILPQKRWNVYNYDNRAKVERDKKRQHERRNQEKEDEMKKESNSRLDNLRHQRKEESGQEFTKGSKRRNPVSEAVRKHQREVTQQEKKVLNPEKPKGVNLFQMEEDMHKQAVQLKQDILSNKYFEGKPFEMDTKFGGNYRNQPAVPWYNKQVPSNKEEEKIVNPITPQIAQQIKEFRKKSSEEFCKVLDFSKKEDVKEKEKEKEGKNEETKERKRRSRSRSRSPKRSKSHKKEAKKYQKELEAEEAARIKRQKLIQEKMKRENEASQMQRQLFREERYF